jgi:lipopolysaccharide transport system ATP-binding protein
MVNVKFSNARFEFPDYENSGRSLKKMLFKSSFLPWKKSLGSPVYEARERQGLFDINLEICPGDRLGLIGPNGAGKTTFLRSISGVYAPVYGQLAVTGSVGSLLSIGIGTDALATGFENIFIKGIGMGLRLGEINAKIEEIIEFSELGGAINDPVRTYSSGMYMKLMFAIVTSFRKDIVVMDEWLSVGDYSFNQKAESRLKGYVDGSEIFVFASHSRRQIEKLCNKVAYLKSGKIVFLGKPKEVCDAYWGENKDG